MGCNDSKPLPELSEKDIARFWSHVDKTPGQGPHGECWGWKAGLNKGYGKFSIKGRTVLANRVALFLCTGLDPFPLLACHSCDWRPCCNGDHLWPGTQDANRKDAAMKGRTASGDCSGVCLHPERWLAARAIQRKNPELLNPARAALAAHPELRAHGERHGSRTHPERIVHGQDCHTAKLTEQQVIEIFSLLKEGHTSAELQKRFGVSSYPIYAILTGKSWKHIPRPT